MAIQDLSHLASGSLSMGCSMASGNTLSETPAFAPEGSVSEQTQGVGTHNHPEMDLGPVSRHVDTKISGSTEYPMTERTWKKVTPGG
jgi:hypothetical protein